MVQSHYAFGLVIFTRCALVLKGYINIPTLKALVKIRASIHGLKDLLEKKTKQAPHFSEHMNLYQLKCCCLCSNHLHHQNPLTFHLMSQHLASSKKQSLRLSAQHHTSTGKIFLESHCQGIVYNLPPLYFNSHKLRHQCCCEQPEFQYTCISQFWHPSILLDYTFLPSFCFPLNILC